MSGYWTTQDGVRIRISKMDNIHLINSLRVLRRLRDEVQAFLNSFYYPQGEYARTDYDRMEEEALEEKYKLEEKINQLEKEIDRREKLKIKSKIKISSRCGISFS